MSDSLRPYGLKPIMFLYPQIFQASKHTGLSCHALLQGIFPTQGLNPCLLPLPARAGRLSTTSTTWEVLDLSLCPNQAATLIIKTRVCFTAFPTWRQCSGHLHSSPPCQVHLHPVRPLSGPIPPPSLPGASQTSLISAAGGAEGLSVGIFLDAS